MSDTPPAPGAVRAVRDHIDSRLSDLLANVRRLVEIESPSGDAEGNRGANDLLIELARANPAVTAVERLPAGGGEHLLIRAFEHNADSPNAATLLLGHTDTVYERGTLAARPVRTDDGRLYAPGVFDMKANCVLALELLRARAELDLPTAHPVRLLLTCDEEVGSFSGRRFVEEQAAQARRVLVLEPSAGGAVKTGRKGTGLWTITAHGVAAHAGLNPEAGASAVRELARQVNRIYDFADGRAAAGAATTVNVGTIRGGTRPNVVADFASIELDVRFSTLDEAARAERFVANLSARDTRVRLENTGGINRPPLERTAHVAALYDEARGVAAALDFDLAEAQVGGASDGNFAAACCPAILDGLGITGDGAHAAHEHIRIDDIARRGALIAGLL